MVDLIAKTPLDDMPSFTIGTLTVSEVDLGVLTSIAPFAGQSKAVAAAIKDAHGVAWPAPGRATGKDGARVIWFGRDMVMLAGPAPDAQLGKTAAITDQSDGWTAVQVSGRNVEDVLARLVPVDLSAAAFKRGHTARTQVQHMNGSVTRTGSDTFLILVFRSMAATLLHDLERAMASVASRG